MTIERFLQRQMRSRTHRVGGYLLAGAGVVLLLAALFPAPRMFALGIAAILAAVLGSFVYSYLAWKQETST